MRARQRRNLLRQRRRTIYRAKLKRHAGRCPCFVCGTHVQLIDATLEHIVPLARGGTDEMDNLDISHEECNRKKGCRL